MEVLTLGVMLILSVVFGLAATGTILSVAISIFERRAAAKRTPSVPPNPALSSAPILHS
jgi:hypothetical protein